MSGTLRYDFAGATAFVTGATGGMGRAIVEAFAAAGANVFATDAIAGTFDSPRVVFHQLDVSDEDAVRAAVEACLARFGGLQHAVNAAAIENESGPLHECETAAFNRMMAVNVNGVFFCMKHQLNAMLAAPEPKGTIVNIASTNSFRPQPNQPAYTAAKHAVLGITRSAAIDYAPRGIRVNAICPGSIDTPMLRNAMERRGRDPKDVIARLSLVNRFGTPEEIAQASLWLSSDGSSFTLGHALAVDAGYLAR
jgi:NAD(P)-dependent dehydrogenase (short-subunit alcohol dehydrogenase family)